MADDKYKILFFSKEADDTESIQNEIASTSSVIEVCSSWEEAFNRVQAGGINTFFANLFVFDSDGFNRLNHLRVVAPSLTTSLISASNVSVSRDQMKKIGNIVVVDKPIKAGAIETMVGKIKRGQEVFLREQARFSARQLIVFEKLPDGQSHKALVTSLSKIGAGLEYMGQLLKTGDLVKLLIPLEQIKKTHTIYAKVVWTKDANGIQAVGLFFLAEEEAFNLLLDKAAG